MANIKITDLTAYTDPLNTDVLPIVDVTSDTTKKVSIADLLKNASAGTAAAPGIAFDGDPNTGIYSPGADQLAISTGGTGRLFVDASGFVGIGTATPQSELTVRGSNPQITLEPTNDTTQNCRIEFALTDGTVQSQITGGGSQGSEIRFSQGPTERLRIDSSGRLGLGTNAAYAKLHVNGDIRCSFFADGSDFIGWGSGSGTGKFAYISATNEGPQDVGLSFNVTTNAGISNIEAIRIDDLGNVGIGTAVPSATLDARGAVRLGNQASGDGTTVINTSNGVYIGTNSGTTTTTVVPFQIGAYPAGPGYTATPDQAIVLDGWSGGAVYHNAIVNRKGRDLSFHTAITGNGFSDTNERARITSDGKLGLGTSSPSLIFNAVGPSSQAAQIVAGFAGTSGTNGHGAAIGFSAEGIADRYKTGIGNIRTGGFDISALCFYANNTASGGNFTSSDERMRITSDGKVGIGTQTPAVALHCNADFASTNTVERVAAFYRASSGTAGAGIGAEISLGAEMGNGLLNTACTIRGILSAAANAGEMVLTTGDSSGTQQERIRIDSSGRLLVGTSTARTNFFNLATTVAPNLQLEGSGDLRRFSITCCDANGSGSQVILAHQRSGTVGGNTVLIADDEIGSIRFQGSDGSELVEAASIKAEVDGTPGANDMPGRLVFSTTAPTASSPTEAMQIDSAGRVGINSSGPLLSSDELLTVYQGGSTFSKDYGVAVRVNRGGSDGDLVLFYHSGVPEGSISSSGTTISYNGAHLSRWSQLVGIDPYNKTARPEILRGTVMSNLDEMCDWTCPTSGDCQDNEQLNKTEISSVDDDPNVAGVFQAWDDDDDTWVNDFYLAMTGDFVIRIAAGKTVQRGDLLCSAGDGTARPQGDRYLKDSTIAKVTSTVVSCTYPDGSYCVPCVLMAC